MPTWQRLKQNPVLFQRYFVKEYLIKSVRKFFENKNYHELESPIFSPALPQEKFINVLSTQISYKNKESKKVYIIPTTETYNKKVLAAGLGEHFVIAKVARGLEEISPNHSPEFTMLEWYHLNATFFDLMDDCENLIIFALENIAEQLEKEKELGRFPIDNDLIERFKSKKLPYNNIIIDFAKGWYRVSIDELMKKHCGFGLSEAQDRETFAKKLKELGLNVNMEDDWQTLFEMMFAERCEPNLPTDRPVFVHSYPAQVCVLTKPSEANPEVCERVELYIAGKEVANGYTELLDATYQKKRFLEEQSEREKLGLEPIAFDNDLIDALASGLPPVAGIGMGIDRVAMILANAKSIADINYFPALEWV